MNQLDVAPPAACAPTDQLESIVQGHLRGRVHRLQLQISPDGIILRGWARTYHAKQLAQHLVMRLTHLPILANDIEVI